MLLGLAHFSCSYRLYCAALALNCSTHRKVTFGIETCMFLGAGDSNTAQVHCIHKEYCTTTVQVQTLLEGTGTNHMHASMCISSIVLIFSSVHNIVNFPIVVEGFTHMMITVCVQAGKPED